MDQMMNEEIEGIDVDSDSRNLSRAYCIKVHVNEDGTFSVIGPIQYDKEEKDMAEDSQAQVAESLPDALKLIMKTVRENPISEDAQAEMDAGYLAGPGGKMSLSHYM